MARIKADTWVVIFQTEHLSKGNNREIERKFVPPHLSIEKIGLLHTLDLKICKKYPSVSIDTEGTDGREKKKAYRVFMLSQPLDMKLSAVPEKIFRVQRVGIDTNAPCGFFSAGCA
ncbi:MAG: hypothetical protein Q4D44_00500 [Eubacteriales bacterium]|nr:hypothetical protein [Eubacteriales bacterium]